MIAHDSVDDADEPPPEVTLGRPQRRFIVRESRPVDRVVIHELTMRAYREYAKTMDPVTWAGLEHALEDALASNEPAQRFVAVDGDTLIGSVMLYPPSTPYGAFTAALSWPEVRLLAVPPEARGRGVAHALMTTCVRVAKDAGAAHLGIHTSRSMRVAMTMYERMGFVRAPEHDFQPAGAELVEAYRLPLV